MRDIPFELHIFNAGAGFASAIRLPNGNWGIVDWGVTGREEELLERIGKSTVEFICATHPHEDHTIGLPNLVKVLVEKKRQPIRTFWYPVNSLHDSSSPLTVTLQYLVDRHPRIDFHTTSIRSDDNFPVLAGEEGWRIISLAPPEDRANREEIRASMNLRVAGNTSSSIMLFYYMNSNGRVLIGGDADIPSWNFAQSLIKASRYPISLDNQICVLPHHGSMHNMPSWLYNHLKGAAVISSAANDPDHPSFVVLDNLRNTKCQVFCTNISHACNNVFGRTGLPSIEDEINPCMGDMVFSLTPNGQWNQIKNSYTEIRFCNII